MQKEYVRLSAVQSNTLQFQWHGVFGMFAISLVIQALIVDMWLMRIDSICSSAENENLIGLQARVGVPG